MQARFRPITVTLIYVAIGSAWIFFTDHLLELSGVKDWAYISMVKGLLFVLVTGAILYRLLVGALRDIRRTEMRYQALFTSSPDAQYLIDAQGKIIDANEVTVSRYGYSYRELLSMSPTDLAAPDLRDRVPEMLRSAMRNPVRFEWRHARKDGSELPVEVIGKPVVIAGKPCILSSARDMTQVKRAEAELLASQDQLRQAQKMQAIGQLAGGIAHDFNNLLQVILGAVAMAQGDIAPGGPAAECLAEVDNAGKRAAALVSQLLTVSRRRVMQREALDLNEVAQDVLKMLRRVIGAHIQIDFQPTAPLERIYADRSMMEQVFMNLAVNARDAMPNGGNLTVATRNVDVKDTDAQARLGQPVGRYVLIEVSDTGKGMDSQTMERVFEPFFTNKPVGDGTGLGLATVYGIVKQHGGVVLVESELGRGATFRVYLPVSDRSAAAAGVRESSASAGAGNETILVAEDEEGVRQLTAKILTAAGYTVLAAASGGEAVALFERNAAGVDLVLLDQVMPDTSGSEARRRILQIRPETPVVFMSGYSDPAAQAEFAQSEKTLLLQKPFDADTLLQTVRTALGAAGPPAGKSMRES
jgi:two-component system, cell cycle sensor histidine kinase and response regulator CckA